MIAVIYARYSTDSQREESIEGQIRECTAYAEKNGFTVVKHYIDCAVSAKTDNRPQFRPQFQQMIKDSERGIFDVIIVWKLDRFARNRYDSARYKTQLKRNGVKLVSGQKSFRLARRASFWNRCWRATPNTTRLTCLKRSCAA